jgi:hypothetical protein
MLNYDYFANRISEKALKLSLLMSRLARSNKDLTSGQINKLTGSYLSLRKAFKGLGVFRFKVSAPQYTFLEYPEMFFNKLYDAIKHKHK